LCLEAMERLVRPGDAVLDGMTPREALLKGLPDAKAGGAELYQRVMTLVRGQEAGEGFA